MKQQHVAVVSGGMGGLGRAICLALAGVGCRVIAADLPHPERLADFEAAMDGQPVAFAALQRWHGKLTVVYVMAVAGIVGVVLQNTVV